MTPPRASAKITRPHTPRALPRLRLFEQLDQGRAQRLTWIAAPPGAGKTTLVCSYLDARKLPCLWYQIDADDRDPAAFFYHLGVAVAQAAPRYRRPLPALTPEYLLGITTFTRNFFREAARRLHPPHVLVFDNLQEVDPAAPLYEVLREGLSELPDGLQGILISRSEPAANFARMRVSGHLAVLDWDALRLRPEETRPFLERLDHRGALPVEVATRLHEQCAGWAAGLILLHEGVTKETPGHAVVDAASAQRTFDYFATEVFARRQPAVKELLMLTALFPSFTATMAARISGYRQADSWLNDLVQSHHFTERRAGTGADYQYHPLFRSFLLAQAQKTWGPAELARRRHRAAILLEDSGRAEEALALYLDTKDWGAATRLILRHAPTILAAGRFLTLGAALRRLPAAELEAEPWLSYWLGMCSLAINPGGALTLFDAAFERFERDRNATGAYLAWAGAADAIVFQATDYRQFAPWLERLDRLIEAYPEFPTSEIEARVAGGAIAAGMWHRPAHPSFVRWLQRAATLVRTCDHPATCARLVFHWLVSWFWYGTDRDSAAAAEMFDAAARLTRRLTDAPFEHILLTITETHRHILAGETDRGLAATQAALDISQRSGVHLIDPVLIGGGTWACLAAGRLAAADTLLQRMQERIEVVASNKMDRDFYWHLYAWRAALAGDFRAALHRLASSLQIHETLQATPTLTNTLLNQALYQVELGDLDAARASLARADDLMQGTPDGCLRHQRLLVAAQLARAEQREAEACELLGEAVRTKVANNFFVLPAPLARLCALALKRDIEADAARTLIRRLRLTPPGGMQPETWPWPVKVYTLGRFSLLLDGTPARFSGKIQKKPLELLKALIAFGGRDVSETRLTEALWPEAEGDAAHRALDTTLHRLRKLLGSDEAVMLQEGRLTLDPRYCWVDVWAFDRLTETTRAKLAKGPSVPEEEIVDLSQKALTLYQGSFLSQESEIPWTLSERERLRSRFLRYLEALGRHWEQTGQWERAVECYLKGLDIDHLAEGIYQRLMTAYHRLGRRAEAMGVYQRCRNTLSALLGVEPSSQTEGIYRKIIS
ncbi:MAG: BTAD domain-containing putative transcriptional regulator [Nitrospirota bacterium]